MDISKQEEERLAAEREQQEAELQAIKEYAEQERQKRIAEEESLTRLRAEREAEESRLTQLRMASTKSLKEEVNDIRQVSHTLDEENFKQLFGEMGNAVKIIGVDPGKPGGDMTASSVNRPTDLSIVGVLAVYYDIHEREVVLWIKDMDLESLEKEIAERSLCDGN